MSEREARFASTARMLLESGAEQRRLEEIIRKREVLIDELREQIEELNGENEGIHAALMLAWRAGHDLAALQIETVTTEWFIDYEPLFGDGEPRVNHALDEADARHRAAREGLKVLKRSAYFSAMEAVS